MPENGQASPQKREGLKWLSRIVWSTIIFLIITSIGRFTYSYFLPPESATSTETEKVKAIPPVITPEDWANVDKAIMTAVTTANDEAQKYAEEQLTIWVDELKVKADKHFVDWYFGYWTQQVLGIKGLWYSTQYYIDSWLFGDGSGSDSVERITEELQIRFATHVLEPTLAENRIEQITQEAVKRYVNILGSELNQIPEQYQISSEDWGAHLEQIVFMTSAVNGNRDQPLTLKAMVFGSGLGGAALVGQVTPALAKLTTKITSKMVTKAGSKLAVATAEKLAAKPIGQALAKIGGKFLGAFVGVGIIAWDVYDHYKTKEENRPMLQENLHTYLDDIKYQLLNSPEGGINTIIDSLSLDLLQQLEERNS
jgi:hypothetical protein